MKQIYFTVTNDLSFDQRMNRICTSLTKEGYSITLVGRKLRNSKPLEQKIFSQKRIKCWYNKGPLFYIEFNMRLFFFLLSHKADAVCAIDLDTIIPVLLTTSIKKQIRIYDAHEFFTELVEVNKRPVIKKIWSAIERFAVPRFRYGYTVSDGIAIEFLNRYKRNYIVIRNLPLLRDLFPEHSEERFLLYQGAVNEGRGFEYLIPAMEHIPYRLVICGDGNFMEKLKQLIEIHQVQHKVILKGMLAYEELWVIARKATLGLSFTEKAGLNQYYALPNKLFDYIQAALPQITMNLPEYAKINDQFGVAVLIDNIDTDTIAKAVNETMKNEELLTRLKENCIIARNILCWQNEEIKLIAYYKSIFN